MTGHLRPTAPIFSDALLPSDPGVALALAQQLLVKPLMANHEFGLWGYSGETAGGCELTIQSAGIGGPSAATVLAELAGFGTERVIALGTCTALDPALSEGAVVLAASARAEPDPDSSVTAGVAVADPVLTAALAAACPGALSLPVASVYTHADADISFAGTGASVIDLTTAALLGTGARLGLAVACALIVSGDGQSAQSTDGLLELGSRAVEAFRR